MQTEAERIAKGLTAGQARTLLVASKVGAPWYLARTAGESNAGRSLEEKRLVHRDKPGGGAGTWLLVTDLGRAVADAIRAERGEGNAL